MSTFPFRKRVGVRVLLGIDGVQRGWELPGARWPVRLLVRARRQHNVPGDYVAGRRREQEVVAVVRAQTGDLHALTHRCSEPFRIVDQCATMSSRGMNPSGSPPA